MLFSPIMANGRHIKMNGPLHFNLSLKSATTTVISGQRCLIKGVVIPVPVRTAAGTYGGTRWNAVSYDFSE